MFSVSEDVIREEYDDLQDLDSEQMERVREWEQQLSGATAVSMTLYLLNYIPAMPCLALHMHNPLL